LARFWPSFKGDCRSKGSFCLGILVLAMNNQEIARVLSDIADFLEAKEIRFKPRAYRQAAEFIERSSQDIAGIYRQKGVDGLEAYRLLAKI
jgi:hypothetical protein